MKPGIRFIREWADEDMVELRTEICDGHSLFVNRINVGHQLLRDTVTGLDAFKDQIAGGIFNIRFGEFGAEYAAGALDARLHFRSRGMLLVQVSAQSEFTCFDGKELASEAKLHFVSEPAQLDEFIRALKSLSEADCDEAELNTRPWT